VPAPFCWKAEGFARKDQAAALRQAGSRSMVCAVYLDFSSFQDLNQIAASMHNPLDANRVCTDSEENDVLPQNCQSRLRPNLRAQPIKLRLDCDLVNPRANHLQ